MKGFRWWDPFLARIFKRAHKRVRAAGVLGDALPPSPLARWRRNVEQISNRLRVHVWFPHGLVALAVAVLGVINLLPALRFLGLSHGHLPTLARLMTMQALREAPQTIAGLMLLAMAGGLLLRSRLSWAIALLLAATTLAFVWHGAGGPASALTIFNGLTLLALLVFQRGFDRSSLAAGTLFAIVSVLLLMGYAVFGAFVLGQGFSPPVTNLSTALYFAVITMSSVGYGDIVPKTADARFFVVSVVILGITVFATSISAVIVPAVTGRMQRLMKGESKRMARKNHYIIVGDTPLARNTCRELLARHLPVTVIVTSPIESSEFPNLDVVLGDPSDTETLKRAGVLQSAAVLALRDDDSENAFTVLAVKELSGNIRTVAAVNHTRNMTRIRNVRPDMVIAPQVMGGELLAMALNNETMDNDTVMAKLFHSEVPKPQDRKT
ncbi:MAG TPA: voltage-gated potassium channel protein [Acidiferrobacter sp.]|nr:voltage-gated potassium channel protein [Acidiferrobacter sp.]